jgi:hypothetical protein
MARLGSVISESDALLFFRFDVAARTVGEREGHSPVATAATLPTFRYAGHGIGILSLAHDENPGVAVVAEQPVGMRVVWKHNVRHLTDGLDLDIETKRVDIRFFKIEGAVWFYFIFFESLDPVDRPFTVPGKIT